jgi:hypothetical protein
MVSLGGGYPNPQTFAFSKVTVELAGGGPPLVLAGSELDRATQYGATEGLAALTEQLLGWHRAKDGVTLAPDGLIVTNGSQEALYVLADVLLDEEDELLVEEPTYPGALAAFRSFTEWLTAVPLDREGLRTDLLETLLRERAARGAPLPRALYTIVSGHNPAGVTLSEPRRRHLAALATTHDLLVIEDDPYELIRLEDAPALPTVQSLAPGEVLLHQVPDGREGVRGKGSLRTAGKVTFRHAGPVGPPLPERRPDVLQPLEAEEIRCERNHDRIAGQQGRAVQGPEARPHVEEHHVCLGLLGRQMDERPERRGHVEGPLVSAGGRLGPLLGQRLLELRERQVAGQQEELIGHLDQPRRPQFPLATAHRIDAVEHRVAEARLLPDVDQPVLVEEDGRQVALWVVVDDHDPTLHPLDHVRQIEREGRLAHATLVVEEHHRLHVRPRTITRVNPSTSTASGGFPFRSSCRRTSLTPRPSFCT